MSRFHSRMVVALAVTLLTAGLAPSRAVANDYNEGVDGDLPSANPLVLLTLDPGLNTVSGTFGNVGFPTDYDSFAFTIPGGLALMGGGVEVTDNVNNIVSVDWELRTGAVAGAGAVIEEVSSLSPGADAFGGLPSGTYHIGAVSFSVFGQSTADYIFSFNVVEVPEPATCALLGLASFALVRPRRTPTSSR